MGIVILYRVAFGCSHEDIWRKNILGSGKTQERNGSIVSEKQWRGWYDSHGGKRVD